MIKNFANRAIYLSAFLSLFFLLPNSVYAQYTWSLGDLSTAASRLNVNWNQSEWADAYDTEAELNAMGWTTVNIEESTPGITCTHGGAGSSEDKAGLQALLEANCPGRSGFTPGVCNNVFKIAANCTIDTLSDYTNDNGSQPGINIHYSNFALIGTSLTTSVISVNNVVNTPADMFAEMFGTGLNDFGIGGADGAIFTWDSADTSIKGQSVIQIDNNCSGVAPGDLVRILGADPGGSQLVYNARIIAEAVDGTDCDITVSDPLPTTFTTKTSVTIDGQGGPKNQVYMNFRGGFPYIPAGACTSDTQTISLGCGAGLDTRNSQQLLIQNVRWGPLGHAPLATNQSYRVVVRNNDFGPVTHTLRRQNNGGMLSRNVGGSLWSVYNNIFREGVIRVGYFSDGSAQFGYLGFNYQVPQLPSNPLEGGNYCNSITQPQGFPNSSAGPERSVYLNHDAPIGPGLVGQLLIEANDFKCRFQKEGIHNNGRYITLFRNRFIGQSPIVDFAGGDIGYVNLIANRAGSWGFAANIMDNVLGNWNIGVTAIPTPTGTSVTWPTSGAGRNYLAPGAHGDYATTNIPPSLGIRTSNAPSWWCQESGPWNGAWSFAYGDGGDNGGVPRKLPAQIRHEGGTCTPPTSVPRLLRPANPSVVR